MRTRERGSALIIATIVVLIIAVIGVGMVRFTQRETAGALAGQRADAMSACAAAAQNLLLSRFHVLGTQPTDLSVLNVKLDGSAGRFSALGGHLDADPSLPVATIAQVVPLPVLALVQKDTMSDLTNWMGGVGQEGGKAYKVTVHCQESATSSNLGARALEIEYAVRFGL